MFLKRVTHGVGRRRVYWRLVESIRTARGPRHRTVAYLGELRPSERLGWARLSRILDGKAAAKAQQLSLFEALGADADEVADTVEVELKGVRVGRSRDFGDVFLALALWRMLGLDEFFARELPAGREEVPWAAMACVLALARFLEPDSELRIEDTWYRRTALAELLGVSVEQVNDSRLYRALDVVLPLKAKLEAHLRSRLGELFTPKPEILLYDVTSTYFEGLAEANAQAQYGYSRDHRPDCKQVCIGLVVTTEGFPLASRGRARNISALSTVAHQEVSCASGHGPYSGQTSLDTLRLPGRSGTALEGRQERGKAEGGVVRPFSGPLFLQVVWHRSERKIFRISPPAGKGGRRPAGGRLLGPARSRSTAFPGEGGMPSPAGSAEPRGLASGRTSGLRASVLGGSVLVPMLADGGKDLEGFLERRFLGLRALGRARRPEPFEDEAVGGGLPADAADDGAGHSLSSERRA